MRRLLPRLASSVSLEPVSKPGCACSRNFHESVCATHQRVLKLLVTMLMLAGPFTHSASGGTDLSVIDFLPKGFVIDGTVSYQTEIQQAIDAAAESGRTLVFPSGTYAAHEAGWQLPSGTKLRMYGAVFQVRSEAAADGAVFWGKSVRNVILEGGEIVGRNDVWSDGVNIRGVHITGRSSDIKIRDMSLRDLSSNGIGILGSKEHPVQDVWVRDVVIQNCCNRYPDYLSGEKWEQGSQREDQGLIAFYYVDDFVVTGCRLERSRSDGTHFYHARRGHITDNRIYRAKMGGLFLETCENVIGRGNTMLNNGSRGATIERGSRDCIFSGNVVSNSGREGLWAPNCTGLVVTDNFFTRNGRKPNGEEQHHIWNANITINDARHDPSGTATRDYLVSNNVIDTSAGQVAAIRVATTDSSRAIVIRGNLLRGENREISVSGPQAAEATIQSNTGR